MLASILSYGLTMTSLTSCEDNKDNPSGSEVPQFKVQKEDFKWDFTYKNKVYLDPRINKDLITTFDELMPNQQEAIDEDTKVVIISRFDDVPFEQLTVFMTAIQEIEQEINGSESDNTEGGES